MLRGAPMHDPFAAWDFDLPDAHIARYAVEPRDSARLLVLPLDGGPWSDRQVSDLPDLLRAGDLLVANDTRVMPARLRAHRGTGGAVEIFLLSSDGDDVPCLLRPARRLVVGEVLSLVGGGRATLVARPDEDGVGRVRLDLPAAELMARSGEMPLPPYLGRASEEGDRTRYQTVFSGPVGSAAAPTAGLHFTPELLAQLAERGVGFATVTLHVGIGTFRKLHPEDLERGLLHPEPWSVPQATADAIAATKAAGGRVIAVGTTSTRVLESAVGEDGLVRAGLGVTRLFVRPPYDFRVIDGLMTNFHLPKSSLLMLVGALGGQDRVLDAYRHAVASGYRFFSYGDAMLLT